MKLSPRYTWYRNKLYFKREERFAGKASRGLAKTLKATFWPHYRHGNITQVPRSTTDVGRSVRQAKAFGRRVDKLIARSVLDVKDTQPEVAKFRELCGKRKWTLCNAQLPVSSPSTRIGTCIDVVAYDAENEQYVAIEVKTGYRSRTCSTGKSFRHPFLKVCDSSLHQHQAQAFFGGVLLSETYGVVATSALVYMRDSLPPDVYLQCDYDPGVIASKDGVLSILTLSA
jgi:hypothetical protein